MDFKQLRRLKDEYDLARTMVAAERAALKDARRAAEDAAAARDLIQHAAQAVQETAHARLADTVTRCLKAVFGEEAYTFAIHFDRKRGRTEARLVFIRDGREVDPTEAAGGGVVDVASFALRLGCLLLSVPRRRRLLVLDEPFRCLSRNHRPKVRAMLEALAKELGVQMILVTHDEALECGKVVKL